MHQSRHRQWRSPEIGQAIAAALAQEGNDVVITGRRSDVLAITAGQIGGTPADIAATVLFLASPRARHITGQVIHVNGGALSR